MPTKLMKDFCDFFFKFTCKGINNCITEEDFISSNFKEAEVRPLHKNDGRADKSNYRPINILPNVLKTY